MRTWADDLRWLCDALGLRKPAVLGSVAEELASRLSAGATRFVRLPGARHTIFRDRPDLAFSAVKAFVAQTRGSHPAS